MNKSVVILTVVVLLILATGCSQPAPSQTVVTYEPTLAPTTPQQETIVTQQAILTTGTVSPTIPNAVSENTIRINKKGFDPASITVKAGSTVRWVNEDSTSDPGLYNPTHRVAIVNIKNQQLLSPGDSCSWIFGQPGSYDYEDMIHSGLHGIVIVV